MKEMKEGGHLLTKAATLQEDVSIYQEKLSNMKEEYKDRVQLALSYLSPRARARHTPLVEVNQALVSLVV